MRLLAQVLSQGQSLGIIHVDHGGLQAAPAKQQRLGLPAGLHAAMVVEVVGREVGEADFLGRPALSYHLRFHGSL